MLSCVRSWQATIDESLPIRKARHSYGWDIMPRAVSAGIWKDAYIVDEGNYDFNQLAYFYKEFCQHGAPCDHDYVFLRDERSA